LRRRNGDRAYNLLDHQGVHRKPLHHADIGTTAQYYSTVSPEHEANAQWIIEPLFLSSPEKSDAEVTPVSDSDAIRVAG